MVAMVAASAACFGCTDKSSLTNDEQNITAACQVLDVSTGKTITAAKLATLRDPVAQFVIGSGACPKSFQEIQKKVDERKTCRRAATRLVTNRSQLLDVGDDYRAVVSRSCDRDPTSMPFEADALLDFTLLMSVFGIRAADVDGELPGDLELIGMQSTKKASAGEIEGVFNFYAREGGQWKFFGSGESFVNGGYDCNPDGACIPKLAASARCSACHVGGGLIMKELHSPWNNWEVGPKFEGARMTPGAEALFDKHGDLLGGAGEAKGLEALVESGNAAWLKRRVQAVLESGSPNAVAELLRPLFCTIDINLETAGRGVLFDQALSNVEVPFDGLDFQTPATANHQLIMDGRNAACARAIATSSFDNATRLLRATPPCTPLQKDGTDLVNTFAGSDVPSRSQLDSDYVRALTCDNGAGGTVAGCVPLIDKELAMDVRAVDMSRPIFSKNRCDLLRFVPKLSASAIHPKAINDGLLAALAGQTGAAAELRNNLDDHTLDRNRKRADAFARACQTRSAKDPLGLARDLVLYFSHLRQATRRVRKAAATPTPQLQQPGTGIIEFPETLPIDDVKEDGLAFDPATCLRTLR